MTLEPYTVNDRAPSMLDRHTDSWVQVLASVGELAAAVQDTEFVPKDMRGRPAAIAAAILHGREIGLPPMQALRMTFIVNGRPSLAAEAMRALVYAHGHSIEIRESTGKRAVVAGRRKDETHWTEVEWTWDHARYAGLTDKPTWRAYPRQLLLARCSSDLCKLKFPDVIGGYPAVEDSDEILDATPEQDAEPPAPRKRVARKTAVQPVPAALREPVPGQQTLPPFKPSVEPPRSAADGSAEPDMTDRDAVALAVGRAEMDEWPEPAAHQEQPAADAQAEQAEAAPQPASPPPGDARHEADPLPTQAPPAAAPGPAREQPRTDDQARAIITSLRKLGVETHADRVRVMRGMLALPNLDSSSQLSMTQASALLDTLRRIEEQPDAPQRLWVVVGIAERSRRAVAVEDEPAPDEPAAAPTEAVLPNFDDDDADGWDQQP